MGAGLAARGAARGGPGVKRAGAAVVVRRLEAFANTHQRLREADVPAPCARARQLTLP